MSAPAPNINTVHAKLAWMRDGRIWPNGLRYLWTDAFGLVLLVSLHRRLGEAHYLAEAEWLVSEVERVLGRPRGIRIGEAPDPDGIRPRGHHPRDGVHGTFPGDFLHRARDG